MCALASDRESEVVTNTLSTRFFPYVSTLRHANLALTWRLDSRSWRAACQSSPTSSHYIFLRIYPQLRYHIALLSRWYPGSCSTFIVTPPLSRNSLPTYGRQTWTQLTDQRSLKLKIHRMVSTTAYDFPPTTSLKIRPQAFPLHQSLKGRWGIHWHRVHPVPT